jgi:hypothetical protein
MDPEQWFFNDVWLRLFRHNDSKFKVVQFMM